MKRIQLAGVVTSLFVSLLLTGCGDVYRPVVDPFQTPGGDPQTSTNAYVLNQGVVAPSSCPTPPCQGSVSQIDVPGDVNMNNKFVAAGPWHIFASTGAAYVANREAGSVSVFAPRSAFSLDTGGPVGTISLPAGTQPTFVHSTQTDAVYVALRTT
ncbi:MAG TPA: hypothetical protein VD837_09440, partial [Terriglobales bacterium]|nr:hypothetical protein [Terriglobales bacterium]